jgi:hypothetical protein
MAFKLKSGNKPGFKNMGSSPAKDMKTGSYSQSFEDSPAKQKQQSSEEAFKAWEKGSKGANQMLNKRVEVLKTLKKVTKTEVPKGAKSIDAASNYEKDFKKVYDALPKTKKKLSAKDLKGKSAKEVVKMLLKQGFTPTPMANFKEKSPANSGTHEGTLKHHEAGKMHSHSTKRSQTKKGILTEQRINFPPEKKGEPGSYGVTSRSGEQKSMAKYASPAKQDYVGNVYHPKWNPGGTVDFDGNPVKKPTNLKNISKAKKNLTKKVIKKKAVKKVAGKLLTRLIPGVGGALLAYDVGKWAYKNRKDIKKQAKETQKKRFDNPSDHGRPKY